MRARVLSLSSRSLRLALLLGVVGLAAVSVSALPGQAIDLHDPVNLRIVGRDAGDRLGRSIAVGDFNADGHSDIAVGCPGADATGNISGRVFVFYGAPLVAGAFDMASHQPDLDIWGATPEGRLGQALATGDFNGDGVDDLVVQEANGGPPGRLTAGASFIFFGGTSTWRAGVIESAAAAADVAIWGAVVGELAGTSYAVGDLNGDTIDDLMLAAPASDRPADYLSNTGAVYALHGAADLPDSIDLRDEADLTILGSQSQGFLGTSLGLADVTGDGAVDLLVGAQGLDRNSSFDDSGAVAVFMDVAARSGVIDLTAHNPDVILWGAARDGAGAAVDVGDVDGDGHADILVGAPGASPADRATAGAAYLVPGPLATASPEVDLAVAAIATVWGPSAGAMAGDAVALVDLSGDGLAEIMVNAPEADVQDRSFAGLIAIYYGRADLDAPVLDLHVSDPDVVVWGDTAFTRGPWHILAADVNGSGQRDLVLGIAQAGLEDRNQPGTVYGLFDPVGSPPTPTGGPPATPTLSPTQTATASPTATSTLTATATPPTTYPATLTMTATPTTTHTTTPTAMLTMTATPSPTHTVTPSATLAPTPAPSATVTVQPPPDLYLPLVRVHARSFVGRSSAMLHLAHWEY